MKSHIYIYRKLSVYIFFLLSISFLNAATFTVGSQAEFNTALSKVSANDIIIWKSKATPYNNIEMIINKSNITIRAEVAGEVVFSGSSRVILNGDSINFSGFQFLNGDIGTKNVVEIRGQDINFKDINISGYTCYKYLVVQEQSRRTDISYCNFENRANYADKNILSILVDPAGPGYHTIRHSSFRNFSVPNGVPTGDAGVEPIRIGVGAAQSDRNSRTIVEYCYFTQCNGDGEIISNKARQNVLRYNTFENNPVGELVLRHGNEALVYGNFFINGNGGVRAREGRDHFIFNNYFQNLTRSIWLLDIDSDVTATRLKNVNIINNTFVKTGPVRLEGSGNLIVENTVIANNIFYEPTSRHFQDANGTETYIGNVASGSLGITDPQDNSKIRIVNPELELNSDGFYELKSNSPAIDGALSGYPLVAAYPGLDTDNNLLFDIVKNSRPTAITLKDVGCSEFPQNNTIKPIATSENTGPSYITGTLSVDGVSKEGLGISLFPNPTNDILNLLLTNKSLNDVSLTVFDYTGKVVKVLGKNMIINDFKPISYDISDLSASLYILRIETIQGNNSKNLISTKKIIKK